MSSMSSSRRREESSILLLVPSTMILSCVSISFSIQDEFLRESSPQLALISPQSFNCYKSHNFSALTTPIDCLEFFFVVTETVNFLTSLKNRDTDWLEAAKYRYTWVLRIGQCIQLSASLVCEYRDALVDTENVLWHEPRPFRFN